jgi:hypothetical protein
LKEQLEKGMTNHAINSTDSITASQAVDNDAAVREERERLKRLQEQWSEKLREAEVELAVERAKLARQRAELEEQHRGTTGETNTPVAADSNPLGSPSYRGRWLARLGLTDADREPRRVINP